MNKDILKNWEKYRLKEELEAIKLMILPGCFSIIFMLRGMSTALYTDDIPLALGYISMSVGCLSLTIALERTQGLKIEKIEILLEQVHQIMEELKGKEEQKNEDQKKSDN